VICVSGFDAYRGHGNARRPCVLLTQGQGVYTVGSVVADLATKLRRYWILGSVWPDRGTRSCQKKFILPRLPHQMDALFVAQLNSVQEGGD
jgi:hypothetical protein